MSATLEPGVTPDLIANLRCRVAAAPDGKSVLLLRSDVLAALLDSIDLPAEHPDPTPWPVPGSVAIATVRGVEVPVFRLRDDLWAAADRGTSDIGWSTHSDRDVTVTSRAVVVTETDVDTLIAILGNTDHLESAETDAVREWFAAQLGGERA